LAGIRPFLRRNALRRVGRRAASAGRWGRATATTLSVAAAIGLLCAPAPAAASAVPGARQIVGLAPATTLGNGEYARMSVGNVRTLRLPMFWADLEPSPGTFDWRAMDVEVAFAAYYGMRLRPFILGLPAWVQRGSHSSDYPPVSSRFFQKNWKYLLVQLIDRYGPKGLLWKYLHAVAPQIRKQPIRSWQIWNEPNARTYWKPGATAAEGYAKLLRISATTIRRHDPSAKVIAAGLFLQPLDGVTMPQFVDELYKQPGAAASFDALALHPYARSVAGVLKQIRLARRLMAENGDATKPLWITELGWPTQRAYGRGLFVKSEGAQKRLLARTFRTILANRQRWHIGSLTWYTWRDNNLFTTCDLCRFSGLFRADLTPKPAWGAFTQIMGGSAKVPTSRSRPRLPLPVPRSFSP
jgi:hypothetical protein